MLRTFAALLRISEVEDGARRALFREVDLVQIAADAVEYYEPAADEKSIHLSLDPPAVGGNGTIISGDMDLLFEAFGNLIDNAIKYTPEGGHIRVELQDGPVVSITDDGCGIDALDRDKLQLRFERGSRSRGLPGLGLGLPLVSAIARLHGLALHFDDVERGCRAVLAPLALSGAPRQKLIKGSAA